MDNNSIDNTVNAIKYFSIVFPAATGVIGALIGAAIGFFTTKKQLEHNSRERKLDRDSEIRRSVYLEVAETVAAGTEMLAGLTKANVFSKDFNTLIKGYLAAINKVHIIGTPETIKAITEYNAAFSTATLYLVTKKVPAAKIQVEIDSLDSLIANFTALRDEYSAKFHEVLRNNPNDAQQAEYYHKHFVDLSNRITTLIEEKTNKSKLLFNETQEFSLELASVTARLAPYLKDACISVRREMGNPIDESQYAEIIKQATEGTPEVLKAYFEELKKQIEEEK